MLLMSFILIQNITYIEQKSPQTKKLELQNSYKPATIEPFIHTTDSKALQSDRRLISSIRTY